MSTPSGPTPHLYDERLRALGDQVVHRFLALLKVGRSYDPSNAVFRIQLDHFLSALRPVFDDSDEAVLVALENDLYLNGVRVPVKTQTFKAHETLRSELGRRGIVGLRITRDVRPEDVERLFRLLLDSSEQHGTALLESCLAEGLDSIHPVVHATTSVPDAMRFGDDRPASSTPRPEAGGITAGPPPSVVGAEAAASRGAAPRSFAAAVAGARSVLVTTVLHDAVELRHARRVVQPLVEAADSGEPLVLGLATLGHHDELAYAHAVNVVMVAVTMGHVLGFDRRALSDLGIAALLHDVGKSGVLERLPRDRQTWTDDDCRRADTHTIAGARQIARSTLLNVTALRSMRCALEHHAGPGGHPRIGGDEASVFSQVVGVADCYVSLLTRHDARGEKVTPYQAVGMILGPLAERFEPALLGVLVRAVGLYPAGQMVELSDGSQAVVLAPDPDDIARPHVRVMTTPFGEWLPGDRHVDLRPLPEGLTVRRALGTGPEPPASDDVAA
jgi:HD-GYP domain-containing protein (c-di-GMP phosphodiesterase class II)